MHPVLFRIGPFVIYTYGVFIAAAVFISLALFQREVRRKNFFPAMISNLVFYVIISGIIGARILHVIINLNYYLHNPAEILMVWKGGLAIHGALLGGTTAGWFYCRKNGIPVIKTMDLFMPFIALGQSIGRVGCFFNGCCYGKETTSILFGVLSPGNGLLRYPTQILASFVMLCIYIFLRYIQWKTDYRGLVLSCYMLLYGFYRFFSDFLRGDGLVQIFGFTLTQIISFFIFITALLFLLSGKWRG